MAASVELERLFEECELEELQGMEKARRREIEEKKKMVRQLVATRYRDLIASAESIVSMNALSQLLASSLEGIEAQCRRVELLESHPSSRSHPSSSSSSLDDSNNSQQLAERFSAASRLRVLVELPEQIWTQLEASDYGHAWQLYEQAHTLYHDQQQAHSLKAHPLLVRQWNIIDQFPDKIKAGARGVLAEPWPAPEAVRGALYALGHSPSLFYACRVEAVSAARFDQSPPLPFPSPRVTPSSPSSPSSPSFFHANEAAVTLRVMFSVLDYSLSLVESLAFETSQSIVSQLDHFQPKDSPIHSSSSSSSMLLDFLERCHTECISSRGRQLLQQCTPSLADLNGCQAFIASALSYLPASSMLQRLLHAMVSTRLLQLIEALVEALSSSDLSAVPRLREGRATVDSFGSPEISRAFESQLEGRLLAVVEQLRGHLGSSQNDMACAMTCLSLRQLALDLLAPSPRSRDIADALEALSKIPYQQWVSSVAADVSAFLAQLLARHDPRDDALLWTPVQVEDQKHLVPSLPSTWCWQALFFIAEQWRRCPQPPAFLLQEFRQQLSQVFLSQLAAEIEQHKANQLQSLFDIRFLQLIFDSPDAPFAESLLRTLEAEIDPIDLAFYRPLLRDFAVRALQRSSLLVRSICPSVSTLMESHQEASGGSFAPSHRMPHHIIKLAPTSPRFSLLPVTAPNS